MKPSNYFILAAMLAGYLGTFLTGLLGSWTLSLLPWFLSMVLVTLSIIELKDDKVARAMVASWFMACALGTMAHVSVSWSMFMILPVMIAMAAWALYIRREILISHSSGVLGE